MAQKARSGWSLRAHTQALPGEPPQSRAHRAPACATWPPLSCVSISILSSDQRASGPQSQGLTVRPTPGSGPAAWALCLQHPPKGFVLNVPPFPETNAREARPQYPPGIHLGSESEPQLLQGGTLSGQRGQELVQVPRLRPGGEGAQQVEGVREVSTWDMQLLRAPSRHQRATRVHPTRVRCPARCQAGDS